MVQGYVDAAGVIASAGILTDLLEDFHCPRAELGRRALVRRIWPPEPGRGGVQFRLGIDRVVTMLVHELKMPFEHVFACSA